MSTNLLIYSLETQEPLEEHEYMLNFFGLSEAILRKDGSVYLYMNRAFADKKKVKTEYLILDRCQIQLVLEKPKVVRQSKKRTFDDAFADCNQ